MLIFIVDTTSIHGGVAVYRDAECLAMAPNRESSGYSVTLFQATEKVLAEAGGKVVNCKLNLDDIDLFAAANGPGSFTGIRTGLAAIQGWATALRKPVVGFSILEAMAHQARFETESAAAIIDAHRDEFYVGLFRRVKNSDRAVVQIDQGGFVLAGEGVERLIQSQLDDSQRAAWVTCILREHDPAASGLAEHSEALRKLKWEVVPDCLLQSIAELALEASTSGKTVKPADLDAFYIRRTDAELNWRA